MRREPTADIDHTQIDLGFGESRVDSRGGADRAVPLTECCLLRADMEGNPVWVEAKLTGSAQKSERHFGGATEFPRQRPLGALASHKDAAEYSRTGRRP